MATLKLAKVWFLSELEIETYLKAVKKDLSPDWEDASVQLADVEVGMELGSCEDLSCKNNLRFANVRLETLVKSL